MLKQYKKGKKMYTKVPINPSIVARMFSVLGNKKLVSHVIKYYLKHKKEVEVYANSVTRDGKEKYYVLCKLADRYNVSKKFKYISRSITKVQYSFLISRQKGAEIEDKDYENSVDYTTIKCSHCGNIHNRGNIMYCAECSAFLE